MSRQAATTAMSPGVIMRDLRLDLIRGLSPWPISLITFRRMSLDYHPQLQLQ
jgi:hypothetical protein